jgi:hypothetical protein
MDSITLYYYHVLKALPELRWNLIIRIYMVILYYGVCMLCEIRDKGRVTETKSVTKAPY